jgi:hypothetical protein
VKALSLSPLFSQAVNLAMLRSPDCPFNTFFHVSSSSRYLQGTLTCSSSAVSVKLSSPLFPQSSLKDLVSSYCTTLVNTFVSLGLLLLHTQPYKLWTWNPPFKAPKILIVLFFISNIFLLVIPFLPPFKGSRTYERLAYWVSTSVLSQLCKTNLNLPFFRQAHPVGILISVIGISMFGVYGFLSGKGIDLKESGFRQTTGCLGWCLNKKVSSEMPLREGGGEMIK